MLSPKLINDSLRGDDLASVQSEDGQNGSLPQPSQRNRLATVETQLKRPENAQPNFPHAENLNSDEQGVQKGRDRPQLREKPLNGSSVVTPPGSAATADWKFDHALPAACPVSSA